MASKFNKSNHRFFDDNGNVAAGYKLRFKAAGSDTLKNTYTASDLGTPNANPVILNEDGMHSDIWLDGAYKVELLDASDVEVWETDNVGPDVTSKQFDAWSSLTSYRSGDFAEGSDGAYYISITSSNQGNDPTSSAANWTEVDIVKRWNTNETYAAGALVKASDNRLYRCLSESAGDDPTSYANKAYWFPVGGLTRRAIVSTGGVLQDASFGIASVNRPSTGRFDLTLDTAVSVSSQNDVLCLATSNSAGGGIFATAAMTSTTVCRVDLKTDAGTDVNTNFSVTIIDWGD